MPHPSNGEAGRAGFGVERLMTLPKLTSAQRKLLAGLVADPGSYVAQDEADKRTVNALVRRGFLDYGTSPTGAYEAWYITAAGRAALRGES